VGDAARGKTACGESGTGSSGLGTHDLGKERIKTRSFKVSKGSRRKISRRGKGEGDDRKRRKPEHAAIRRIRKRKKHKGKAYKKAVTVEHSRHHVTRDHSNESSLDQLRTEAEGRNVQPIKSVVPNHVALQFGQFRWREEKTGPKRQTGYLCIFREG